MYCPSNTEENNKKDLKQDVKQIIQNFNQVPPEYKCRVLFSAFWWYARVHSTGTLSFKISISRNKNYKWG
jgi:hypothetical protein